MIKKIIKELSTEASKRGIYFALLMNISHFVAIMRGFFYRLIYIKHIESSIFFMQSNSKIEIFNKHSKVSIGKFVFIRKNASFRVDFHGQLVISDHVFINDNCNVNCVNRVEIGRKTKIAPNVSINDHDHNYKNTSNQHLITGDVIIGENVWIGSNVVILKDTFIGDNAVIAAGSVVKGHVPANSLYMNKREERFIPFSRESKLVTS